VLPVAINTSVLVLPVAVKTSLPVFPVAVKTLSQCYLWQSKHLT
jgi:hypothetical protein